MPNIMGREFSSLLQLFWCFIRQDSFTVSCLCCIWRRKTSIFASISQFYTAFQVHLFLSKLAFEKQDSSGMNFLKLDLGQTSGPISPLFEMIEKNGYNILSKSPESSLMARALYNHPIANVILPISRKEKQLTAMLGSWSVSQQHDGELSRSSQNWPQDLVHKEWKLKLLFFSPRQTVKL